MTQSPKAHVLAGSDEVGVAPSAAGRLLLLSADLMLAMQLEAPARAVELSLVSIETGAALPMALATGLPRIVVIDLAQAIFPLNETYQMIRRSAPEASILGFYPHVQSELGDRAKAAGCDLVIPRSRFFMNTAAILAELLQSGGLT